MRILHATDLHFNKSWFEWIANQQEHFDIFAISGDFLDEAKDETLSEQIEWISQWIEKFKKPIFTCSGNHDIEEIGREDWLNAIDNPNHFSDGAVKKIGNLTIGAFPYIGGDYYQFLDCDILITHVPPAKTRTAYHKKYQDDWGDIELFQYLTNGTLSAKIVLSGHIHSPLKSIDKIGKTTIYNPGVREDSQIPNHQIINLKDS